MINRDQFGRIYPTKVTLLYSHDVIGSDHDTFMAKFNALVQAVYEIQQQLFTDDKFVKPEDIV